MKNNTMKTIVLMVSKVFPAYHPRKGEPTNFKEKILSGEKIHTIRGNYELWKKRIDQVNNGEAILSLRQWTEKPYKSKQVEIKQLSSCNDIGIQKLQFFESSNRAVWINNDEKFVWCDVVCKNDGLEEYDFYDWFKPYDLSKPMAIIHFTGFRY